MKRLALLLLALLASAAASAQNVTVIGPVTPGNVPVFNSPTVLKDSGQTPGGAATVFNVKSAPCNAVGNGVADDTAAINTCIANFNSAGKGQLYFPAGTYKTTAALTAITANGIVEGDGITNLNSASPQAATTIQETSNSVALFTVNSQSLLFTNLALQNTAGSTPVAGSSGILVTSANVQQKVDYLNLFVAGFYIDVDVKVGSGWSMVNGNLRDPVQYAMRVNNTVNVDVGDWAIVNSQFNSGVYTPAAAIRIEGSGGGKISNIKINTFTPTQFADGIDVVGSGATVDLFISNSSIENFSGTGININGSWPGIAIVGVEFGIFASAATHAISAVNTSILTISNIAFQNTGYSGAPINLSSCTNCYVSGIMGQTNPFVGGSKPDHDGTGGIGTFYLPDATVATETRLNWQIPAGQIGEFRILQDTGTPTQQVEYMVFNDLGTRGEFAVYGSTNSNASMANKTMFGGATGVVIKSDDTVSTGGTDDISLRSGGDAQEAMLVQHNGHISMTAQNQAAPTLTAGCNGAGSAVSGSDANGTITGQTAAATTCTLTFGAAYATAPNCAITGLSSPLTGAITVGTGSLVVNFASTANYKWSYVCFGK